MEPTLSTVICPCFCFTIKIAYLQELYSLIIALRRATAFSSEGRVTLFRHFRHPIPFKFHQIWSQKSLNLVTLCLRGYNFSKHYLKLDGGWGTLEWGYSVWNWDLIEFRRSIGFLSFIWTILSHGSLNVHELFKIFFGAHQTKNRNWKNRNKKVQKVNFEAILLQIFIRFTISFSLLNHTHRFLQYSHESRGGKFRILRGKQENGGCIKEKYV